VRRRLCTALALAALGAAGCGGDDDGGGEGGLSWVQDPVAGVRSELRPDDRVVGGDVRNNSLRELDIAASDVRLIDEDGKSVPGVVTFQKTGGHGLWPVGRINRQPLSEQYRLGMRRKLKPGQTSPLVVAWEQTPGLEPPVKVEVGRISLPLRTSSPRY
jgi:hypothetical protein